MSPTSVSFEGGCIDFEISMISVSAMIEIGRIDLIEACINTIIGLKVSCVQAQTD